MNGGQDLGGMMGFGPINPEQDEPWFHAAWERRAFALTLAMGATGAWNLDQSRHARESVSPAEYLTSSYYQIWLTGIIKLMAERGLVTRQELAADKVLDNPKPLPRRLNADMVPAVLAKGGPTSRQIDGQPQFAIGDHVRARNINPTGHTRLPRYVRGHMGQITQCYGAHVFPDSNARGQGEKPQWLYCVRFDGRELWGADADPTVSVSVDAWQDYLEAV